MILLRVTLPLLILLASICLSNLSCCAMNSGVKLFTKASSARFLKLLLGAIVELVLSLEVENKTEIFYLLLPITVKLCALTNVRQDWCLMFCSSGEKIGKKKNLVVNSHGNSRSVRSLYDSSTEPPRTAERYHLGEFWRDHYFEITSVFQ